MLKKAIKILTLNTKVVVNLVHSIILNISQIESVPALHTMCVIYVELQCVNVLQGKNILFFKVLFFTFL